ncbi:MAG: metal-binding protein [Chloroflexi bacterium]|nr:metal-binding protein [Chloroflexota bacterium]
MRYVVVGADRKPYASATPGAWGGHRTSRIYGRLDCPAALRAIARGGYVRHRVFFADEATAIDAGFRPCGTCLPEKYAAWKAAHIAARKSAIPLPTAVPRPIASRGM